MDSQNRTIWLVQTCSTVWLLSKIYSLLCPKIVPTWGSEWAQCLYHRAPARTQASSRSYPTSPLTDSRISPWSTPKDLTSPLDSSNQVRQRLQPFLKSQKMRRKPNWVQALSITQAFSHQKRLRSPNLRTISYKVWTRTRLTRRRLLPARTYRHRCRQKERVWQTSCSNICLQTCQVKAWNFWLIDRQDVRKVSCFLWYLNWFAVGLKLMQFWLFWIWIWILAWQCDVPVCFLFYRGQSIAESFMHWNKNRLICHWAVCWRDPLEDRSWPRGILPPAIQALDTRSSRRAQPTLEFWDRQLRAFWRKLPSGIAA